MLNLCLADMAGQLADLFHLEPTFSLIFLSTLISLFVVLVTILIRSIAKSAKKPLNLPPGSYGLPIIGETIGFIAARLNGTPGKFFKERMEKNKSQVFKTSLMGQSVAVLSGPAANKFLFSNENKLVTVWWPASVSKILGKCLSTSSGIEGMQMRKVMSYFVSPDAFTKLYIKTMDSVARKHLDAHWKGKEEVKVFPTIRLYTFELACRLFMSIEEPSQIKKLAALFEVFIKGLISIPVNVPGTRFFKAKRASNAIRKVLHVIMKQRKLDLEQKKAIPSQDLLSHLLFHPDENGKYMSDSVIINNILMLLFAGHDTSSCVLTMLMKELALHPQVYEKVLTEQNEIAASKAEGEYLQWDDIKNMKYSWYVASESMRMVPPIIGTFREAVVDLKYGGYDIPKGWKLYWSSLLTHRDPSYFPIPDEFEPSRFEGTEPIPYTFVPFGGGPRMCLGKEFARLEILIFLHNVVRKFRWNLQIPGEKVIYEPFPTPVQGLPIRLLPHKA